MSDLHGFMAAIVSLDLNAVRLLFKQDYIDERLDGWTVLHYASMYGSGDIVRYLVSVGWDVDAETDKGCDRPIHYAVICGNIDTLTALIEAQCTLDCTDNDGETPLQIATEEKNIECQNILRAATESELGYVTVCKLSRIEDFETGTIFLDYLLSRNDPNILEVIKSRQIKEEEISDWLSLKSAPINPDSYRLLQECLIYRCIHQGFTRGFETLCTPEMANRRCTVFIDSSILESVVQYRTHFSTNHVLERLENIDETWTRAQDIARNKGYSDVVNLITSRISYLGRLKERGCTRLHVAVSDNCPDMVEYLLEKGVVNTEEGDQVGSTSLECFSDIQRTSYRSLTGQETIYTLCLKLNKSIYPCLIDTIDKETIKLTDSDDNAVLHLAAVLLEHDICAQLIQRGADINGQNRSLNTPLLELLIENNNKIFENIEDKIMETVTVLIKAGADLSIENKQGQTVLDVATEYDSQKLLLAIIGNVDHIKHIKPELWSLWMERKYFDTIKAFIPRADKALLNNYIVIDDIKMNIKDANVDLIKDLYDKASQHVQDSVVESILYKAATMNNSALFEEMINKDIYGNSCLVGGESLLNCLIRERKKDFVDIALGSKNAHLLLEKKNGQKQLPLHVCIESEYWTMLNKISVDTTSVDCEDNDGNTPLALLFKKISATDDRSLLGELSSFVRSLIMNHADINKENKDRMTAIEYCTNNEVRLDIVAFARKHPPPRPIAISPVIVDPSTPVVVPGNVQRPHGAASSQQVCHICEDGPMNCVLNCGHVFCTDCAEKDIKCYVCRKDITDRRFLFN